MWIQKLKYYLVASKYRTISSWHLLRKNIALTLEKTSSQFREADIAIFHEFSPPPGGGGNQFLRALWGELERRGLRVENNSISRTTKVCLYNSFNFDFERLRTLKRLNCLMIHRVDGPISVYRGYDDGSDCHIWKINNELADATIFQSRYSLNKTLELGLEFKSPHVITNAVNPAIFNPMGRIAFDRSRKIRLISTSWSDNPNKGAKVYKQLEDSLDWERFEYTFVGRSKVKFERIRMVPPVNSEQLAEIRRQHDIYITASQHEACSNSLIESLSCGLPAIYIKSGSNAELVGEAGLGFSAPEEIPELLDRLVNEYEERQKKILLPTLAEVCDRYLEVMQV